MHSRTSSLTRLNDVAPYGLEQDREARWHPKSSHRGSRVAGLRNDYGVDGQVASCDLEPTGHLSNLN